MCFTGGTLGGFPIKFLILVVSFISSGIDITLDGFNYAALVLIEHFVRLSVMIFLPLLSHLVLLFRLDYQRSYWLKRNA